MWENLHPYGTIERMTCWPGTKCDPHAFLCPNGSKRYRICHKHLIDEGYISGSHLALQSGEGGAMRAVPCIVVYGNSPHCEKEQVCPMPCPVAASLVTRVTHKKSAPTPPSVSSQVFAGRGRRMRWRWWRCHIHNVILPVLFMWSCQPFSNESACWLVITLWILSVCNNNNNNSNMLADVTWTSL